MTKLLTNTQLSEQTKGRSTSEVTVHGENYFWNVYGCFMGVSRLPGFYGPIDACTNSGYQALFLAHKGPGDEAMHYT